MVEPQKKPRIQDGGERRNIAGMAGQAALVVGLAILLSACASQVETVVSKDPGTPGFLWGMWHGFIFPWSWIGSLLSPEIAVYAVPHRGWTYDAGFFLGITVLGGGSFFGSRSRG
ncbi:MAG: hypothetical protein SXU28_11150 [Pseudomonadota bacterium]|nr:hypothetical protein [Pseudomonadota bacterium]